MVALMRRHPRLYCDIASHRPRYLVAEGSGWEMLLRYGNTVLQDKVMVGLAAEGLGLAPETVIEEYCALPLKDSVKEKWLYGNASNFFRMN